MTDLSPSRRGFLAGLFIAPAIIKLPGLLMPIKRQPALTIIYSNRVLRTWLDVQNIIGRNVLLDIADFEHISIPVTAWRQINAP
jgi:hypothetical protein